MPRHAANDNRKQRAYRTGAGNAEWVVPAFENMSKAEVVTQSAPLVEFQMMLAEAIEVVEREKSPAAECAVYVIADIYGRESKIGKAVNPLLRLAQLQTGNPRKLFVHRVFWSSQELADAIERDSHRTAEMHFGRLEGEWFACTPSDAHDVIESVIGDFPISFCAMTPLRELWRVA